MKSDYIVYAAFDEKGDCLYVGEGVKGRELHITSGVSHVYEANKRHFENKYIRVEILHHCKTKEEVILLEQLEIFNRTPLWNKIVKSTPERVKLNLFVEERVMEVFKFSLCAMLKLRSHPKIKIAETIKYITNRLNAFGVADISNKELHGIYTHNKLLNQIETKHNSNMSKLFIAENKGGGLYRIKLRGWENEE